MLGSTRLAHRLFFYLRARLGLLSAGLLHLATFRSKHAEFLRFGPSVIRGLNVMSSPMGRDEALNLATVISIVIASLIGGAVIGMSLWAVVSKLL